MESTHKKSTLLHQQSSLAILLKSTCCRKNITNSSGKTYPASMLRTRAINRKMQKLGTGSVIEKKRKEKKENKKKK